MAISLKLIGELQYGFGIALVLVSILGVIYFQNLHNNYQELQYRTHNGDIAKPYSGNTSGGFANLMIYVGDPHEIITSFGFTWIFIGETIFSIALGIFMILQGIANIKIAKQQSGITFK